MIPSHDIVERGYTLRVKREEETYFVRTTSFPRASPVVGMGRSLAAAICDLGFRADILLLEFGDLTHGLDERNPGYWDMLVALRLEHLDVRGRCRCSRCRGYT